MPEKSRRLYILGDLSSYPNTVSNRYDMEKIKAVKIFQYRHGLRQDGIIGLSKHAALNIDPTHRQQTINQAIHKWESLSKRQQSSECLHINLASYLLSIYNKEQVKLSMKVIVGNPKWLTPTLQFEIKTVVINPKLNIPTNITDKEINQKVVASPEYLAKKNISIYDGWHKGAKKYLQKVYNGRNTSMKKIYPIDWFKALVNIIP